MLREIFVHAQKAVPANYKAAVALTTGMGVVIDGDEVKLPAEGTTQNIYVVDKERVPTGTNASRVNFSDYEDEFNTVAKGEFVKLRSFDYGEEFATDAFETGVNMGDPLGISSAGKWIKVESSKFVCVDNAHNDAGHTLICIRVVDFVETNTAS